MTVGVTLKSVEKKFGPALAGIGRPETTFSAVRYAGGKGKKFAGVSGVRSDAVFHLHFPFPVDWQQLKTKKGVPDFINDLTSSGPQGEPGREAKFEAFRAARQKKDRLRGMAGKRSIEFSIDGETFRYPGTIKIAKSGKITLQVVV